MVGITKLVHKGDLVGYRFSVDGEKYDVELTTVHKMGISLEGVKKSIELKEVGNLLMSKTEFDNGKLAEDLTNDTRRLNELFKLMKTDANS